MSPENRIQTGDRRHRLSRPQETDDTPFDEVDSPDNNKLSESYFKLLRSVFHQRPVTRHSRIPACRTIGTVEEDVLAASINNFREMLKQDDEREAFKQRRHDDTQAHSLFTLTDFTTPVSPNFMETAAALICECIDEHGVFLRRRRFPKPTFIVSIGIRGCGALTHAIALRLGLPYSLSNWYPDGTEGDIVVNRCEGIGGMGNVYLNSVPKNSVVIVIVDVLFRGNSVRKLIEGIRSVEGIVILGTYTIAQTVQANCAPRTEVAGVPLWALMNIELGCEMTNISRTTPDPSISFPTTCSPLRLMPSSTIRLLKRMSPSDVQKKLCRVTSSFCGVPVIYNSELSYPYCNFALTDFKPALDPELVEDIADLAVHFGDFTRCNVLVSEGDRGGGPMLQAISVRTKLPYVIASWRLSPASGGVKSTVTNVGFSGSNSQLFLSGLKAGMRCTFVDDMLSSGGTAEAVLGCIRAVGAFTVESVFASEKLYPVEGRYLPVRKGKNRLNERFPETTITCLVQFIVRSEQTEEPPSRVGE